ncbi:hypothetical protein D2T32_01785 [Sinirhodobacter populi]|nr:hypothetical protein D2T32_01785 [Sinirhodobacter populi]
MKGKTCQPSFFIMPGNEADQAAFQWKDAPPDVDRVAFWEKDAPPYAAGAGGRRRPPVRPDA